MNEVSETGDKSALILVRKYGLGIAHFNSIECR